MKRGSRDAERITEQAWHNLVSAVESAGETTKDRVGSAAHEARERTRAAIDALAGRSRGPQWGLLAGLTAAAFAIGWLAASAARRTALALADTPEDIDRRSDKHRTVGLRT
ncbi:MAG TPA: hypothetical protein VFC00_00100 [Micromonosporaceae bacterium]|nr:hypothetical protein [Micromonosporaceae bacterium]